MDLNDHVPEYGFDDFARLKYHECLAEREAYGAELCTFQEYVKEYYDWLASQYEHLLSGSKTKKVC